MPQRKTKQRARASAPPDLPGLLLASIDRCREALRRALRAYASEPGGEPLHDLRVALRRSAALARLFGGFPSKGDGKTVRELAQDLRRRLSCARQHDVSRELLAELAKDGGVVAQRVLDAWQPEAGAHPPLEVVLRDCRVTLRQLGRWRGRAALWKPDEEGLRRLAHKLTRRARRARKKVLSIGIPDRESLHAQRIAGKALRYRLEFLLGFEPAAESLIKESRRFQDALGIAHDWACLLADLSERGTALPAATRRGLPRFLARLDAERERRLKAARQASRRLLSLLRSRRLQVRLGSQRL